MAGGRWQWALHLLQHLRAQDLRGKRGRCELRDVGMPLGAAATWPWYVRWLGNMGKKWGNRCIPKYPKMLELSW